LTHGPCGSASRVTVPRSVAVKLTGHHKTESIYRRYAIVSKMDLLAEVAKLGVPHSK
jgi:hypothetical protein